MNSQFESLFRLSLRFLVIAAAFLLLAILLWQARVALLPLFVAVLISTQLVPLVNFLSRRHVPRGLAMIMALLLLLLLTTALATFLFYALVGETGQLAELISSGIDDMVAWIAHQEGKVAPDDVRQAIDALQPALGKLSSQVLGGALGGISIVVQIISGAVLAFTYLVYVVIDGDHVWSWLVARFAPKRQDTVRDMGEAAWTALGSYVRSIALIALVDTLCIAILMLIFDTPIVMTLVALSFVSLFIPILGAWVSGAVVVIATFAAEGLGPGLGMVVGILVIQQLDSMFLTPLIYRQSIRLHPLATISLVILFTGLMGVIGAFVAVPLAAACWAGYMVLEKSLADGQSG